jgi:hypothetical protein
VDVVKSDNKIVLTGRSAGGRLVCAGFPPAKTSSLVAISKGQNVTLTGLVDTIQPMLQADGSDQVTIVLQGKTVKAE